MLKVSETESIAQENHVSQTNNVLDEEQKNKLQLAKDFCRIQTNKVNITTRI